jgi:hypothetical protein
VRVGCGIVYVGRLTTPNAAVDVAIKELYRYVCYFHFHYSLMRKYLKNKKKLRRSVKRGREKE